MDPICSVEEASAYCAHEKGGHLECTQVPLAPLDPNMIEARLVCCGLCHTDLHMIRNDWGISSYPLVPGHEGIGIITRKGSLVPDEYQLGDRVGFGWIRDSCGECTACVIGRENVCRKGYQGTYLGNAKQSGCFGEVVRIDHKWAFPIPENLSSEEAAPLLCAGITVYSPIRDYFKPGMCVGVSGIGGLGHLALSFARAFGAEVVAFSTSPEKELDAKSLGAHHFVCINDSVQTAQFQGRVDLLLVTSCTSMDWRKEMALLAPDGVLCLIGIPPEGTMVSDTIADLVFSQKKIAGSIVGGRQYMREMLRMASLQNIRPKVTVLPFSQVNEAIKLLEEGKMNHNFRIVLSREEN